ncbi:MAG: phenylalanine--tRNA ligase subunit beta [Gammaproteobacteria bacterium]|nr:phenylalanine--tRNA ligase subunit beta [Gammaproteobacteria bacterium]
MKISEAWLREWVDPPVSSEELLEQLTMLGLEVDFTEPAAPAFSGVVVGEVLTAGQHPDADKLSVCEVSDGEQRYNVVCGAPNVRAGMRAAFAAPGAKLPGGVKIRKTKLRGAVSEGMLCSGKELELSEESDRILDLGDGVAVGEPLRTALQLDDTIIDIDLTPNRGDCLSVRGIARELAAHNEVALNSVAVEPVAERIDATFPVRLDEPAGCPRYVGRVIRGIDSTARSPAWMVEKLRRSGIRSISPTVDITSYVMLELGQPMHAFDLARLHGSIHVRAAKPGETLMMLDGSEVRLDEEVLVIADERGVVALAGIMGGEQSGVGDDTQDIFLEAAFFAPRWVGGRPRRFGLFTDAGQRFERGVDWQSQREGIERATQLVLQICGGEPGPLVETVSESHLPEVPSVPLRRTQIERLLGEAVDDDDVSGILERLGMQVSAAGDGNWRIQPPSHRFDIAIEPDLIEELARLRGYDRLPEARPAYAPRAAPVQDAGGGITGLENILLGRGYSQAVTYSFIDAEFARLIEPAHEPLPLLNPISSELAVMRTSLWPGLIGALQHNLNRQQQRVRLFESGLVFTGGEKNLQQVPRVGGIACGPVNPPHWDERQKTVDFFDVKADVHALLHNAGHGDAVFEAADHPALHPGQSTLVSIDGQRQGWLGSLHPRVVQALELNQEAVLFELDLQGLLGGERTEIREISRFPSIRRDINVVVDETVPAQACVEAARAAGPRTLRDVTILSIYAGSGVVSGRKSVALGLILQDLSRTLVDQEVDDAVDQILAGLDQKLGAKLRE